MTSTKLLPLSHPAVDPPKSQYHSPFAELTPGNQGVSRKTDRMIELEQMLSKVQDQTAEEEKNAYAKAYENGENAGIAIGQKRGEQILEALQTLSDEAVSRLNQLQARHAELILEIAEIVARRIVGESLDHHPEQISLMLKEAMDRLPAMSAPCIAIPPDNMELFQKVLADIKLEKTFISDRTLSSECCRIICEEQDILIDPNAAIDRCISDLRAKLTPMPAHDIPGA